MQGQFFWYDLMTTDTAAAAKFYGAVAGWKTQDGGQADHPYTLFTVDGMPRAGLMTVPPGVQGPDRPVWMGYVAVDDVDAMAKRVAEAGGVIHREPTEVPGIIRFAVVADPQGAVFVIAKGMGGQMPDAAPGTPGLVGWRELMGPATRRRCAASTRPCSAGVWSRPTTWGRWAATTS